MDSTNDHCDNSIGLNSSQIELTLLLETNHIFDEPLSGDTHLISSNDFDLEIDDELNFDDLCDSMKSKETDFFDKSNSSFSISTSGTTGNKKRARPKIDTLSGYPERQRSNFNRSLKAERTHNLNKIAQGETKSTIRQNECYTDLQHKMMLEWSDSSKTKKVKLAKSITNGEAYRSEVDLFMRNEKQTSDKNTIFEELDNFTSDKSLVPVKHDLDSSSTKFSVLKFFDHSDNDYVNKLCSAMPSINKSSRNLMQHNENLNSNYHHPFQWNADEVKTKYYQKELSSSSNEIGENALVTRVIDSHVKCSSSCSKNVSKEASLYCTKTNKDAGVLHGSICGKNKIMKKQRGRPKRDPLEGWPKRPLSAYNIFFKHERQQILKSRACDISDIQKKKNTKKTKRRPKKHGIISFADLTRNIAFKWKGLTEEDKAPYKMQAANCMIKYKVKMKEFLSCRQNAKK